MLDDVMDAGKERGEDKLLLEQRAIVGFFRSIMVQSGKR